MENVGIDSFYRISLLAAGAYLEGAYFFKIEKSAPILEKKNALIVAIYGLHF